ncbi:MAG: TolC family protein [Thermoanaerobacteraceae bacterium]|nr:TolC family protein [Thermoanaerobacteraceae bacterium]
MVRTRRAAPPAGPTVVVSTFIVAVVLLTLGLAGAAYASQEGPGVVTLEDAVSMALATSDDLQMAKDNLELKKKAMDETWDQYNAFLRATHIPGTDMYAAVAAGQDPTGAVYKSLYDYRAAQKDYEVEVASVVAVVYQKYSAVVTARGQADAAALNVAAKERELAEAEAKFKYGMESRINLMNKRNSLAAARSELAQAQDKLDKAYADLAELLGLPKGSRPELVSTVDFVPLEVQDVDREIEAVIEASPQVWKAEETVKLQKNIYGMYNSYDVDKINLRMAERAVDMSREQLYLALLQAYNNVKALEENYGVLEESLAAAVEALEVAQLRCELGMITQAEVLSMESTVASLEAQMENLKWQHAMAVKAFYEPWAWTDGAVGL